MNISKEAANILHDDFQRIFSLLNKRTWLKLKSKKILITGASGFIGSYLTQFICYLDDIFGLNIEVICIVRSKAAFIKKHWYKGNKSKIKLVIGDLNSLKLKSLPSFDVCFFCASNASPIHYKSNPIETIKPNLLGLINILEQSSKNTEFIYLSSSEVYGNQPRTILNEDRFGLVDQLNVRSCYAESKRMAENICIAYSEQRNFKIKIVRPFHTYGPGLTSDDGRVFADFIHASAKNQSISLTSDGSARRPFCYIADFISALFFIYFRGNNANAYNVSNPDQEISIKKLANTVARFNSSNNQKVIFSKQNKNYLKSPISRQQVSVDKLKKLGWAPKYSIYEGFKRSVFFEREFIQKKR